MDDDEKEIALLYAKGEYIEYATGRQDVYKRQREKEDDPMKQGALIFDEQTDRYDIRFDLADYYGGLHLSLIHI